MSTDTQKFKSKDLDALSAKYDFHAATSARITSSLAKSLVEDGIVSTSEQGTALISAVRARLAYLATKTAAKKARDESVKAAKAMASVLREKKKSKRASANAAKYEFGGLVLKAGFGEWSPGAFYAFLLEAGAANYSPKARQEFHDRGTALLVEDAAQRQAARAERERLRQAENSATAPDAVQEPKQESNSPVFFFGFTFKVENKLKGYMPDFHSLGFVSGSTVEEIAKALAERSRALVTGLGGIPVPLPLDDARYTTKAKWEKEFAEGAAPEMTEFKKFTVQIPR